MELEDDFSDTDMPPQTTSVGQERTIEEKAAYAQLNRERRDNTLSALEAAWRLIESDPLPDARLLTINSFPEDVSRLLVKGRPFLEPARLLGCSQAAKQVRQLYRRAGKAFAAGRDAFFDALMVYDEKVLRGPHADPDGDAPML